jgi:acetyl esterase
LQTRREALQKARDAKKNFQQARRASEAAIKLTEEQKKRLSELQKQQAILNATIRKELTALLSEDQKKNLRNRAATRPKQRPATHSNVYYGSHERNVMDVWLAKSDSRTPVLVSIHGGGFRGGNKSIDGSLLNACLESGISVVAITYRLSQHAIAPAQFHDSARAIQFVRNNARKWNLDPKRIAATGGSAGAGISLWLGFHEDLANPASEDPVARESSRLACMAVYNGQTSYGPRFIRELFPGTNTYKHSALSLLYDVNLNQLDQLPKEKYELFEEVSAMTHLTKDDAPAMLFYATQIETPITNQSIGIHHPRFGKVLKERMDELGIDCTVRTGSRRGSKEWVKQTMDFLSKHFETE